MQLDFFEGGRRIRLVAQTGLTLACAIVPLFDGPIELSYTLETEGASKGWNISENPICDFERDVGEQKKDFDLGGGYKADLTLCFRGQYGDWQQKDGSYKILSAISYKLPSGTNSGLLPKGSPEVDAYIDKSVSNFQMPDNLTSKLRNKAKDDWWSRSIQPWKESAVLFSVCSFLLWALSFAFGWIVKGFVSPLAYIDRR